MSKLIYVPQSRLAEWRAEHTPKVCPVSKQPLANPVVDHSHKTHLIRGVIDSEINAFEGRIANAYKKLSKPVKTLPLADLLESLVAYLRRTEKPQKVSYLHPKGFTDISKQFKRKKVDEQLAILEGLRQAGAKVTTEEILSLTNSEQRTKLYRKIITANKY
jgi:hypothetical protein